MTSEVSEVGTGEIQKTGMIQRGSEKEIRLDDYIQKRIRVSDSYQDMVLTSNSETRRLLRF